MPFHERVYDQRARAALLCFCADVICRRRRHRPPPGSPLRPGAPLPPFPSQSPPEHSSDSYSDRLERRDETANMQRAREREGGRETAANRKWDCYR